MALLQVHFFSRVLGMMSTIMVIMPERQAKNPFMGAEGELPVLWLLHGGNGNETDWLRFSSIERYVADKELAVVMPCAGISRYCNMTYGGDYHDYLVNELPAICRHFFPLFSDKRELNAIAGLSLGGSGAISLGLRNPDKYGAIGVLSASSIIPLEHLRAKSAGGPQPPGGPGKPSVNRLNFGVEDTADLAGTEHDVLMYGRRNVAEGRPLPRVFHAVGTEDHAYPVGLGLKAYFEGFAGNPYQYEFHQEPGTHSWAFWDKWIQAFLDWLQTGAPSGGQAAGAQKGGV
jgi:putative tributyrin esterase